MNNHQYTTAYPRRRLFRHTVRAAMRLILPLAFQLEVKGQANFPSAGPLLVVANHVAVMEAVLMTVYTPWLVELLGASDIPGDRINTVVMNSYGFIPVNRGHADRSALKNALGVLEQGGVLGLFPEGGTWAAGRMKPQTGVAWLSLHGNAPVLPIGFGGLAGALGNALRLKRPSLSMNIGQPIPPAKIPAGQNRKEYLESYATQVLDAITDLVPAADRRQVTIENERFELEVQVGGDGSWQLPPDELRLAHGDGLARFLHSPVILKVYQKNLQRDVTALQDIAAQQSPQPIIAAVARVLDYLEQENPYFLTYRFGAVEAERMKQGLVELQTLARWADEANQKLKIVPVRRFYSLSEGREVVQTRQDRYEHWM